MRLTNAAVVGHPVGHSLSPVIHREAYRLLGLADWRYGLVDLAPEAFDAFVEGRDASWRGLSVTMPHKEATARLGEPDADVRLTGVANTLVWHAGGVRSCHNTDIEGLVAALRAAGVDGVAHAAIVGAGATGRSTVAALARLGVGSVTVLARRDEAASELAGFARTLLPEATVGEWDAGVPDDAHLLVSTVPAAGADAVAARLAETPGSLRAVFDVIYDPWPTPLGVAAERWGLRVITGLDLLVHQAVEQIRLMTGHSVDAEPLLSAARAELERRASA